MDFDDLPLEPEEKLVLGPLQDGGFFARLDLDWIEYDDSSYGGDRYGTKTLAHATGASPSEAVVKMFAKAGRDFGTVQAPIPYSSGMPSFRDPSMAELEPILGED